MGIMISERLLLKDRKDVLRVHLYCMILNKGVVPYEKDLDVLIALYEMGGYSNGEEQAKFFSDCIERKFKRTIQSIRNTLAKYTEIGVLKRPRNKKRFLSEDCLPSVTTNKIILNHQISHN